MQGGASAKPYLKNASCVNLPLFIYLYFLCSFLLLVILFAVWLVSCLGCQGAHGVADGLVVGIHSRQVLQNALKEIWVLHHIVVIFLLFKSKIKSVRLNQVFVIEEALPCKNQTCSYCESYFLFMISSTVHLNHFLFKGLSTW